MCNSVPLDVSHRRVEILIYRMRIVHVVQTISYIDSFFSKNVKLLNPYSIFYSTAGNITHERAKLMYKIKTIIYFD